MASGTSWKKWGVLVAGLVGLWWAQRSTSHAAVELPSRSPVSGTVVEQTTQADAPVVATLSASSPSAAQADVPAAGPRVDNASLLAAQRFAFESLPAIDGCVGPTRAPRTPHTVMTRFERIATNASGEVFVARELTLAGPKDRAGVDQHAIDCLDRIRGRQMVLPGGAVPPDQVALIQPLTILLPTAPPVAQPH